MLVLSDIFATGRVSVLFTVLAVEEAKSSRTEIFSDSKKLLLVCVGALPFPGDGCCREPYTLSRNLRADKAFLLFPRMAAGFSSKFAHCFS